MTKLNPILDECVDTLRGVGITPRVEHGGKHMRLFWSHNGEQRTHTVPISPSDHRSSMNNRAQLRRILRNDGYFSESPLEPEESVVVADRPRLTIENGMVLADSLDVATHFGKSHKDVLRVIDRLLGEVDAIFAERNFAPSSYIDSTGRSNRCFKLTRDALSLLAMGFTGSAAMRWKVSYIDAFNKMEDELLRIAAPPELEKRINGLSADIAALIDLVAELQASPPVVTAVKAPEHKGKIKPLPRWVKRQFERKARRAA